MSKNSRIPSQNVDPGGWVGALVSVGPTFVRHEDTGGASGTRGRAGDFGRLAGLSWDGTACGRLEWSMPLGPQSLLSRVPLALPVPS